MAGFKYGDGKDLFSDKHQEAAGKKARVVLHRQEPRCELLGEDDGQVHKIPSLARRGFDFQNSPLDLITGLSGLEARKV
nr:2-phosphosulfolactate phosphatase [Vibrio cholerae]